MCTPPHPPSHAHTNNPPPLNPTLPSPTPNTRFLFPFPLPRHPRPPLPQQHILHILCLGGHIKVRVPGATIARKNTCVIITPQYYAPSEPS